MRALAIPSAVPFLLLLSVSVATGAEEPPKHILSKIVSVTKDDKGCFQDLGFVIAEDWKTLEAEIKTRYPTGNNLSGKDNVGKKDTFLGTYVVVVKSQKPIPRVAPCEGVGYGIGFGTDEATAKKDAKSNLGKRWYEFSEKKHGLEVVLSEQR